MLGRVSSFILRVSLLYGEVTPLLRVFLHCPEDKEHCEEYGRLLSADPSKVDKS